MVVTTQPQAGGDAGAPGPLVSQLRGAGGGLTMGLGYTP